MRGGKSARKAVTLLNDVIDAKNVLSTLTPCSLVDLDTTKMDKELCMAVFLKVCA